MAHRLTDFNGFILSGLAVIFFLLVGAILAPVQSAQAQAVEVTDEEPAPVGKERASEYFKKRQIQKKTTSSSRSAASTGGDPRYLALHFGGFLDSNSYSWGGPDQVDVGDLNFGVSYRVGEWVNSMDLLFRSEFTSYSLAAGRAQKLSFLAMLAFPDANSKFPLFFGAGVGPGIFTKQVEGESALALDYQVLAGARFFDVIDTLGFQLEFGLKNELHLLKDGQFSGLFLGAGTVFSF